MLTLGKAAPKFRPLAPVKSGSLADAEGGSESYLMPAMTNLRSVADARRTTAPSLDETRSSIDLIRPSTISTVFTRYYP